MQFSYDKMGRYREEVALNSKISTYCLKNASLRECIHRRSNESI